jgi:alcohol dehydrogenase class IV
MERDTAFQMSAANIRFGPGTTAEVGMDLKEMDIRRTLVVIDPRLRALPPGEVVVESLKSNGVEFEIFDDVEVEPTDSSFQRAARFATEGKFDAFVALGGGSTIDTAKAANLYSTYPADFFYYVNAPIGQGEPIPGPLKPLIAIPTTAGTGSETTGVAIFDYVQEKAKTGIAHRYLKPLLGIIDPDNTRTLPAAVAAATGLDVLSHALESYTAVFFLLLFLCLNDKFEFDLANLQHITSYQHVVSVDRVSIQECAVATVQVTDHDFVVVHQNRTMIATNGVALWTQMTAIGTTNQKSFDGHADYLAGVFSSKDFQFDIHTSLFLLVQGENTTA